MSSSYIIMYKIEVLFPESAVAKSQSTVSYLKILLITKGTTNEILLTSKSKTTIWTQTQSAGLLFIAYFI